MQSEESYQLPVLLFLFENKKFSQILKAMLN